MTLLQSVIYNDIEALYRGKKLPAVKDFEVSGDWIYYSRSDDNNRLYKVKTSGKGSVKISDENVSNISNIEYGWIYYIHDGDLYRMKTDGSRITQITDKASLGYIRRCYEYSLLQN